MRTQKDAAMPISPADQRPRICLAAVGGAKVDVARIHARGLCGSHPSAELAAGSYSDLTMLCGTDVHVTQRAAHGAVETRIFLLEHSSGIARVLHVTWGI